jgi:hypothetical protein
MTNEEEKINPPAPALGPVLTPAKHSQITQPGIFEKTAGKMALLSVR